MNLLKPIRFVGSARLDLAAFPEDARMRVGYALFLVQAGREPADWKPLPTVGAGACEIRVRDADRAFRVIYVAKLKDAVYVLHAFQKQTRRIAAADLDLARRRYAEARSIAREK